jgi:hypothetical protein
MMSVMRHPLINGYALLLGACFFIWPTSVGFEGLPMRLIWIFIALAMSLVSIIAFSKSSNQIPKFKLSPKNFPFATVLILCAVLATIVIKIPFTFFSDEAGISIPSLALLEKVAEMITWPGVILSSLVLAGLFLWACKRLSLRHILMIIAGMAVFSVIIAISIPKTSILVLRYPPLVHLLQSIGTVASAGHLDAIRLPNIIWVFLLAYGIWQITPSWNLLSRSLACIAVLLTPLGWSYHVMLYRACGEMTLGLIIVILLGRILASHEDEERLSPLVGALFALWAIYRQTSIAAFAMSMFILIIFKKRQGAFRATCIAGPIAFLMISAYVLGSFQYSFSLSGRVSDATIPIITPVLQTAIRLPAQLHPVGIIILLLGSALVFLRCSKTIKFTLLTAWAIGITNASVQQIVVPEIWTGYGRFNVLLLLPLAIVMAGIASKEFAPKKIRIAIAGLATLALVLITPFDFVSYANSIRSLPKEEIFHSALAGESPSPMPRVVRQFLEEGITEMVILQPDSSYLDLFIAKGLLTPEERSNLIQISIDWSPEKSSGPGSPILVQAPHGDMTYQPNKTPEWEQKLIDSAEFLRKLPGVSEVRLGEEVVYVVR